MIICLVRHGQTNWNKKTLIQGCTDNVLNETGITQAINVGDYLKEADPSWDIIMSSPLKRAVQTAEIVSKKIDYNKKIIINPQVIERNFGELEGAVLTSDTYDLLFEEKVKDLELKKDLQSRAINALLDISEKYPNQKVLVCSHAQFIKAVITYLDSNFNFRSVLENSSLNYFEVVNKEIKVIKYNIVPKKL